MPSGTPPPYETADIRIGEVIWSKATHATEAVKQQKHLEELAEMSETGVVLDCAFIEVANSELLNLLVRVRTLTKKTKKGFALFNVQENLSDTIKVCNLGPVLPMAKNMSEAKKLAYEAAHGKGGLASTFKRFLKK